MKARMIVLLMLGSICIAMAGIENKTKVDCKIHKVDVARGQPVPVQLENIAVAEITPQLRLIAPGYDIPYQGSTGSTQYGGKLRGKKGKNIRYGTGSGGKSRLWPRQTNK